MRSDRIQSQKIKTTFRLPDDVRLFLDQQAEQNGSSQNSEIIRAVRERMIKFQSVGRNDNEISCASEKAGLA
ncbi:MULTISPECIES: Arc family DNA-binding protein [unclassified Rhizobium]|uniref:Arc family DNA-binding protein n=1 Tax=unclassified Rhizobium TaxID=2613769 RepID=UPI000713CC09|nr:MULTISPECIES: Arc family DNA-binding protein [unclassified Rhizobium]KQT03184.1 hypothetical protein ASG42_24550 [Rhizobium sp. Leaf391]KQU08421.1 hypothetical protein ASG68_22810 [Rhizobium sp. Leaf453]